MENLFSIKNLSKVASKAGHTKVNLERLSKKEVQNAFECFYEEAFENMLGGNLSVAQIQFDFLSDIEINYKDKTNVSDPWAILVMKKDTKDLNDLIVKIIETIHLIEKTTGSQYMQYHIALFSIKEALNELHGNGLYTINFTVKYVNLIKEELNDIFMAILSNLKEDGDLETYEKLASLIEA